MLTKTPPPLRGTLTPPPVGHPLTEGDGEPAGRGTLTQIIDEEQGLTPPAYGLTPLRGWRVFLTKMVNEE